MVDQGLVYSVVLIGNVLPVGEVEEILSLVDHMIEIILSVGAVSHR